MRVESFLSDIFRICKLPEDQFGRVLLCVSEALLNAIQHGNKFNITKSVEIGVKCESNSISIDIRDEGMGFDPLEVEDPTQGLNIKKESGRGIYIIRSLCDSIEFKNNGKCIRIIIDFK